MRNLGLRLALVVALVARVAAPVLAQSQHDVEAQIGAQVYQQLQQKGEIIPHAQVQHYYDILDPIAARIARVADPQYDFPFHFIIVHESQPNAFAVPGGNVYVTDSLLKFVQNKEELAGVLCHETSHDIHHDVINENAKAQRNGTIIGIVGAITGLSNSGFGQLGEQFAYSSITNGFSRQIEGNADHKGAITCAQAGINPWGMVWLFENFEKADTGGTAEFLSDHPTDEHRIAALKQEFAADPSLFGRFSSDIASATPLGAPRFAANHAAVTAARHHGSSRTTAARTGSSHYCCAPHASSNQIHNASGVTIIQGQ